MFLKDLATFHEKTSTPNPYGFKYFGFHFKELCPQHSCSHSKKQSSSSSRLLAVGLVPKHQHTVTSIAIPLEILFFLLVEHKVLWPVRASALPLGVGLIYRSCNIRFIQSYPSLLILSVGHHKVLLVIPFLSSIYLHYQHSFLFQAELYFQALTGQVREAQPKLSAERSVAKLKR